jgi:GntR family transcriptional regulator
MSRTIDPYDAIPKYHQLASILLQKIEDGDWAPLSPIPSERQMETLYNISRTTIREAIANLIRQGYLYREHGKGTFVSPKKLQTGLNELTSFSEDLIKRGIHPGQIILEISREVPPTKIIQKLELSPGASVTRIERVRLGDDIPIGIQISYTVLSEDQIITRYELDEAGSLYNVYKEKYNIILAEADETVEVVLATLEEARLLQIEKGSPLLLNERLSFSQDRKQVEFVKILYRGDRYQYFVHLVRQ